MQRKTVLLLFGGESTEHEVSIESAKNVYDAIDKAKFDVTLCYINKNGKWCLVDDVSGGVEYNPDRAVAPVMGENRFIVTSTNQSIAADVILPILHGNNGEDGVVQALSELMHARMVGSGMASSAFAMDKIITKQIAAANGIPVVDYVSHRSYEPIPKFSDLTGQLGDTLFIKPTNAGSSIGVSKVHNEDEFGRAVTLAHSHSDTILIERAVNAREMEVAVLGNPPDIKISDVGEIKPDAEFYSYESKYDASSKSEIVIPADIDQTTRDTIRDYAGKLFQLLGCKGMARVDFFVDESGKICLNEINTIPGFTNISMYPKLWQADGVSYPELIERLITLALEPATIRP